MLNQTALGACAPVLLIDSPAERRLPHQSRIAAHMPILLLGASRATALRIIDGCVALYRELADGRRIILDILGPGRLLGADLADIHQCKAVTLTLTSVETIDTERALVSIGNAIREMLLRAQAHALLLGRKTAPERVATALLDLAHQFARKSGAPLARGRTTFTLYLTRADLADWLGLTLETVSRCLSALKRSRLIAFDRPELITITDRTALEALAAGHLHA
jgi:CRP-like cAMP-binding protein